MAERELRDAVQASWSIEGPAWGHCEEKKDSFVGSPVYFLLWKPKLAVLNWVKQVAKSPSEKELLNGNTGSPMNFCTQQPSSL